MTHVQTLKSANSQRVDVGRAVDLYSAARCLGESLMCPASAQNLQNDIYGRPASQQTLPVNLDASCAQGSQYPAYRQIAIENQNRPYVPICAAGMRGGGDFMGVGRDMIPQDLYGTGNSGNFVQVYDTANGAPNEWPTPAGPNYRRRMEQPFSFSHDAQRGTYRN